MDRRNNRRGRGGFGNNYPPGGYGGHASHSQIQQPPTSYRRGEKLGPETRQREYKEAQGGFMSHQLRETVAKYVCGFLNSQVEGKLMLGVSDNGEVLGVDNSREDRDRNRIDSAIKDLKPPVFPQDYVLEYCDVFDENGQLIHDKTVIELTVFAKNDLSVLYETNKGECWIRRDASTEKMRPQQIQEWLRQRIDPASNQNELQNLRVDLAGKEELLRKQQAEIQRKDNDVRNTQTKCGRLEKEIEKLEQDNKELKEKSSQNAEQSDAIVHRELQDIKNILEKKNKSRVCSVS